MARRPRVVLLRGHLANPWDLRPWQELLDEYDISVAVTGSNVYETAGIEIPVRRVRSARDALPAGRPAGAAAYVIGERYLGLADVLEGAEIVHSAEIGTWFSAQAARLRRHLGFRLVLTVWETIPWLGAYRWPRERRYRRAVLPAVDLALAATDRARDALLLEGVDPERILVAPPGVDVDRFAGARSQPSARGSALVLSAGRLVWEKGHQDVIRAIAALRRGLAGRPRVDIRLLVVGAGPEGGRLARLADELAVADAIEFRSSVPYDAMPDVYASASCLVLASLPTRSWEEQFGMVLVEAMAAGLPIIATRTGAIPEVVGDAAALVPPGDWAAIAGEIADALDGSGPATVGLDDEILRRCSSERAAERLLNAYARLLRSP